MPSLYEVSVPVFIKNLKVLAFLLNKGIEHVGEDKVSTLLESRLIEDMQPLIYQIQRVSDTAKGLAVRVGGVENPVWEDNETTFPQVQERIAKTIAFLEKVPKDSFEGKDDAEVILPGRAGPTTFTGTTYVTQFAIPNFFFHVVATYALLRKDGVPVGKADYLGRTLPQ